MLDLVRRYMDAGREAVASERAEDLARDLLDWSRRNAERVAGLVRREVQRQLRLAGVATREEVADLRKRVRALERQVTAEAAGRTAGEGTPAGSPAKTSTRKAPAKKTSARKASAKKGGKATSRRATE